MTLSFFWIGGPSWVADIDGLRVGCDPVLAPAGTEYPPVGRRTVGPRPLENGIDSIRLWLLTHDHADHIDGQGLDFISPSATIVARDDLAEFDWWEMTSEDLEELARLPGIVMPRSGEWVELGDR
jgi:L-ascorbate metabolism protein UlaG (beta-lactamase superfamily)